MLNRRETLASALAAPLILRSQIRRTQMRVLLVMADDLGLGLYHHPQARHPNLDRMTAMGRTYPVMWGASLCSVFRAELLTGLESHRVGNLVGKNIQPPDTYSLPSTSGQLLPQLVETWYAGKWHAAAHTNYDHPWGAGCEEFRGSMANLSSYTNWQRVVNGVPAACSTYATVQVAADALLGVLGNKPLVVAAFHAPHTPWGMPPPELTTFDPTLDATIQQLAMVEALDYCLGRLVYEADRHGYTVLFTSDNAGWGEGKGTLRDAGLRVPLLAYGAGVAQGTSDLMIQATDLRATILELLASPSDPLDGESFAGDLQGDPEVAREFIRASSWPELGQLPTMATWDRTARDDRWHLISKDGGASVELYDLQADPGELVNVASSYPAEVARLTAELPTL